MFDYESVGSTYLFEIRIYFDYLFEIKTYFKKKILIYILIFKIKYVKVI